MGTFAESLDCKKDILEEQERNGEVIKSMIAGIEREMDSFVRKVSFDHAKDHYLKSYYSTFMGWHGDYSYGTTDDVEWATIICGSDSGITEDILKPYIENVIRKLGFDIIDLKVFEDFQYQTVRGFFNKVKRKPTDKRGIKVLIEIKW